MLKKGLDFNRYIKDIQKVTKEREKKLVDLNNKVNKKLLELTRLEAKKEEYDKETVKLKGFELDLHKEHKTFSNLFGLLKKKPNFWVFYLGRNYNIRFLGITDKLKPSLDLFKKEKYVISDKERTKLFYKGKRVLVIDADSPINMKIDIDKKELLCDAETFHSLINNVVDYKLTFPQKQPMDIGGFFKKYWILIVIAIIVFILSQQEGGFFQALGIQP